MAATERALIAEPVASGGGRIIASPFQFYTTGEDRLRLVTVNSKAGVVVKMQSRFVDTKGLVQPSAETHTPNTDRTTKTTDHELGVGALLNLTVFASSGSPLQGQTFVIVQLVRGFGAAAIVLGTLLGGYVTGTQHLGWPGSPIDSSLDGQGSIRSFGGTVPLAGAELAEVVPTGARWELLSLVVPFTTNAVVATRSPRLTFSCGAGNAAQVYGTPFVDASQTRLCSFMQGVQHPTTTPTEISIGPLPASIQLIGGSTIFTSTLNMQVGDQFFQPVLTVREYLEVS